MDVDRMTDAEIVEMTDTEIVENRARRLISDLIDGKVRIGTVYDVRNAAERALAATAVEIAKGS